ncbi:hypothetical+protein [Methylocapsa aurea]|uniref:hypothetical protein n=1 Tax=Methylocapsa aurea TaxID=663610 RepID=UPI003D18A26F
MISENFFRSVSIAEDIHVPERFAHYRPTRRALPIVAAIAAPGANMIIAPYGSGKSLAAGIAAIHVRNSKADKSTIGSILPRINQIDRTLGSRFSERLSRRVRGHVITLTGHTANPLAEIASGLGMDRIPKAIEGLSAAIGNGGWDHVAIIWDEFGRHLEGLVSDGRSDELDFVQRLAERASRASSTTISLTLLLHQNLLAYATKLNETSRTEWRKIEGRFNVLRMVEDSQEIYRLVGEVVSAIRPKNLKLEPVAAATVDDVIAAGWLDGLTDSKAVSRVLSSARPLSPGALQILPTLVARVGQNERTLFSFLQEADLGRELGIESVYTAFSDAMRTDVGIGGTYRRWVETESARSRAPTPLHRELLAAACLLQLGTSGERKRLPRRVLELSVASATTKPKDVVKAVETLLDSKLLLWRKHNDDVAVWHGADIDVALRVREEREQRAAAFDVKAFLEQQFPAPYVRAPRHNAHYGVNRFFAGRYQTAAEVLANQAVDPGEQDAAIVYVIAKTRSEINDVRNHVKNNPVPRMIYVVPFRPLEAESAALELVCIEALKADKQFIASDPMVPTEISELESVAFEQLATTMRTILDPRASGAVWFAQGEWLPVSNDRPGTVAASMLFDRWFNQTPRIANDQVMRSQASRTIQTARVRVVGAILERSDRERLGYEAVDRSAEGSIYRTVLENTGLHRSAERSFAEIDQIEDPGMRAAWTIIADFFQSPTPRSEPRPLSNLIDELANSPTGVPKAVMPLLIAAGYKRFARAVAIYKDGVFVSDILGYSFDQMIMTPAGYMVHVERADIAVKDYLREVTYAFTHVRPPLDEELIRSAFDAINHWKQTVPDSAKRTQRLPDGAIAMLNAILSARDPLNLLLKDLPGAFGLSGPEPKTISHIEQARKSIDQLHDSYAEEAVATLAEAFRLAGCEPSGLFVAVRDWAHCFDAAEMDARADLRVSDKAVLRKAIETSNGRFSPKSFAGALSSILLQRGLEKWDDRTAAQFRTVLRETRERIETAALDTARPGAQLRPIIAARIKDLNALLARLDRPGENPDITALPARSAI